MPTAMPPAQAVPPPGAGSPTPTGMYWQIPTPYGRPASVDAAGTVAAPLLAGFSITFIGLVLGLTHPDEMPFREPALIALVLSALALLTCVQCTFWARQYTVAPSELMKWWPDLEDGDAAAGARRVQLRGEQWRYRFLADRWMARARWTYDAGIVALLASVALVLVPPTSHAAARWLAVSLMGLAVAGELYWVIAPGRNLPGVSVLFPTPRDVKDRPEVQPGPYTGAAPVP